jgi:hypothetical protein
MRLFILHRFIAAQLLSAKVQQFFARGFFDTRV